MSAADITPFNRVILAHYDSYSAALLFARWTEGTCSGPRPCPSRPWPCQRRRRPGRPTMARRCAKC